MEGEEVEKALYKSGNGVSVDIPSAYQIVLCSLRLSSVAKSTSPAAIF